MNPAQFISSNWEAIVASCAIVISIIAILISLINIKIQRTHNQKSLKPMIYIEPYDYENCILIKIKNEGLGPAIVRKIRVQKNEYEVKSNVFSWLPPKLPRDMNYKEYWTRSNDFVLRPGSLDHMLEIPVDIENEIQVTERENIRGILSQLTVYVEYSDIYENLMPIYSRSLSLFGRPDHEN